MSVERKPVGPSIAAALIILPLLYAVSFGPASWVSSRVTILVPAVEIVYSPVLFTWGCFATTPHVTDFLHWYSQLGAARGWYWTSGNEWKGGH